MAVDRSVARAGQARTLTKKERDEQLRRRHASQAAYGLKRLEEGKRFLKYEPERASPFFGEAVAAFLESLQLEHSRDARETLTTSALEAIELYFDATLMAGKAATALAILRETLPALRELPLTPEQRIASQSSLIVRAGDANFASGAYETAISCYSTGIILLNMLRGRSYEDSPLWADSTARKAGVLERLKALRTLGSFVANIDTHSIDGAVLDRPFSESNSKLEEWPFEHLLSFAHAGQETDVAAASEQETESRALLARYLDTKNVPETLRTEIIQELELMIARATRPKWADRLQHLGLAHLSAPAFLKQVHADDIGPDGSIPKETLRAIDPELLGVVESYISRRLSREAGLGDAEGLNLIAKNPRGPSLQRAPKRPSVRKDRRIRTRAP